jgi:hypothetical protein
MLHASWCLGAKTNLNPLFSWDHSTWNSGWGPFAINCRSGACCVGPPIVHPYIQICSWTRYWAAWWHWHDCHSLVQLSFRWRAWYTILGTSSIWLLHIIQKISFRKCKKWSRCIKMYVPPSCSCSLPLWCESCKILYNDENVLGLLQS